ncbi:MAG: helix-turn-helix domain-containing protein [Tagaea sp.]|nr:helix-turn-helix domain-containing protein [Tagaea sp.]
MLHGTRIVVLPRFRVVLTGATGPEEAHAHLQAAAAVVLAPPARRYRVADAEYEADPEHILLVNPMTEHRALAGGGPVLGLLIAPDFVAERVAVKRGVVPARPFGAVRAPLAAALRGRAERLAALLDDPASADGAIDAAAAEFAGGVLDAHAQCAPPGGPAFDYRIRRAIQVAAGAAGAATVEAMLVASELSRSRFFQLFRECTGLTPQMYIDAHAVESAIDALTRSSKPVTRIARELGYGTPERFARYVKRMTGVGPRDFRRAAVRV